MDHLNPHSKAILSCLLQSDHYVTANDLGEKVNLTARIVRYKIDEAEPWLNSQEAIIEKKHGKGYRIVCSPIKRNELLESIKGITEQLVFMNPSDRRSTILLNAFLTTEPLLVKQLERKLNVSRSTILRDFDEITNWLNDKQLKLVRKPNFGFQIAGQEIDNRLGIVDLLVDCVAAQDFIEIFSHKYLKYDQLHNNKTELEKELSAYIEELNLVEIAQIIQNIFTEHRIQISDFAYNKIVLYISILANRIQKGFFNEEVSTASFNLEDNKEYFFATKILNTVQQKFKLVFPLSEIANLSIQILQANVIMEDASATVNVRKSRSKTEIVNCVKQFIKAVSLHLHPSLQANNRLLEILVLHITRLIYRTENQARISNPVLGEIQEKFPEVYRVAKAYSPLIENELGTTIPEDEIGFLAIYLESALQKLQLSLQPINVLIVNTSDTATSLLLYSRIKAEFPDLNVVGTVSLREFHEWIDNYSVQLIISNTQVDGGMIPSVKVGNFLNQEDISRIKDKINKQIKSNYFQESLLELDWKPALKEVLPTENIQLSVRAVDWKDAVTKAVNILVKSGGVEPRYVKAVIAQHEENGSYMIIAPGIALLHAQPSDGARSVSFCLCRLDPPIAFNHPYNDPVDIVIAFSAISPHSHERALNEIVRLLENAEFLKIVRKAKFPGEIIQFVKSLKSKVD